MFRLLEAVRHKLPAADTGGSRAAGKVSLASLQLDGSTPALQAAISPKLDNPQLARIVKVPILRPHTHRTTHYFIDGHGPYVLAVYCTCIQYQYTDPGGPRRKHAHVYVPCCFQATGDADALRHSSDSRFSTSTVSMADHRSPRTADRDIDGLDELLGELDKELGKPRHNECN